MTTDVASQLRETETPAANAPGNRWRNRYKMIVVGPTRDQDHIEIVESEQTFPSRDYAVSIARRKLETFKPPGVTVRYLGPFEID